MRRSIEEGQPVTLAVRRGGYRAETVLAPETVEQLRSDLAPA